MGPTRPGSRRRTGRETPDEKKNEIRGGRRGCLETSAQKSLSGVWGQIYKSGGGGEEPGEFGLRTNPRPSTTGEGTTTPGLEKDGETKDDVGRTEGPPERVVKDCCFGPDV